jgi:hypothetical protein
LEQGLDLVPNDPFPAQSLENSLDKLTFMVQQHDEQLGRAIKASRTNVLSGSEFVISAADRANKVFSFDGSGDLAVTQELGVWQGDWVSGKSFSVRDIVKDASNSNIYICVTAHTSSGSTPISSNADSSKWALLIDAAAAAASQAAAAASETAAQTAQTAAEAAQAAAETAETNAETAETNAETAETNAETAQTAAEAAQAAAELVYDNFDDRYLGAKSTSGGDPTLDNDGDALIDGALFFDTTNNVLKVYNLGTTTWLRTTPTTSDQTNIDTVSGIQANVTTVAGISGDVTSVAGISADVTTVAADGTDIGTVAGISANVTTVAGISSDVTTVAGISADVSAVEDIAANVTTVAGVSANVTTVAGISSNVTTVAGISANVTTVAGSIANVNTVATNLAGVNSFAERYRVESSDPSTSLDEGDLAFNTTSNLLKYYNGTSWQSIAPGIGAVADDSTPQLGGDLDTNGNDILFGDNEKATFGAGSDLQIYHNGNDSVVRDAGTGDLLLGGSTNVKITTSGFGETMAKFTTNGAAELYYDNAAKLATTSTGIDVTGTAEVDTLKFSDNTTQTSAGASTGKAIAMAIVFG